MPLPDRFEIVSYRHHIDGEDTVSEHGFALEITLAGIYFLKKYLLLERECNVYHCSVGTPKPFMRLSRVLSQQYERTFSRP